MIPRRCFGGTKVELSTLCFGSMRLPADEEDGALRDLLLRLFDSGVTSLHSSTEYDTFPRFSRVLADALRSRPGVRCEHVVKLAAPHFGHDRFDANELFAKVDGYRMALNSDSIDVVQWMLRYDLAQEHRRLEILRSSAARIGDAVAELRANGRIGAFACFPYTRTFAGAVASEKWCDGFVDYLNLLEKDSVAQLDDEQVGFVALRPLAAGRLVAARIPGAEDSLSTALQFPLLHPRVSSIVLSVSSVAHAEQAIKAVQGARVDEQAFARGVSTTVELVDLP